MTDLKIGNVVAAPGTRVRGVIPVTNLPGGRSLDIPIIVLNGVEPGTCVWAELIFYYIPKYILEYYKPIILAQIRLC